MLINLTDVFTSGGKDRSESIIFEPDSFIYMGNEYRILDKSPVEMTFSNIGDGRALLKGSMELVLEIPCDRCLQTVEEPLQLAFEEEVFSPDAEGQMDEQEFMSGYELDVEAFVNNEILINMPAKVLCKPDCRGVCMQCGQNLNMRECGCDTFIPDPRMAAIKDIFNADKEV